MSCRLDQYTTDTTKARQCETLPLPSLIPHRIENKRSSTTTLLGGRGGARLTAGRGVSGTSASAVVVRTTVVIGVIVRSIGVRIVVATSSGGVSPSRGVVVVSLAVSSGWHDDGGLSMK